MKREHLLFILLGISLATVNALADEVIGQSVLRIETGAPGSEARTARQNLEHVKSEIRQLDNDIRETRQQALLYRGLRSSGGGVTAQQFDTLISGLMLERTQRLAEQREFETALLEEAEANNLPVEYQATDFSN